MLLINIPTWEDKYSVTIDGDMFWIVHRIGFDFDRDRHIFCAVFGQHFVCFQDHHFFHLFTRNDGKGLFGSYDLDIFVVDDLEIELMFLVLGILEQEDIGVFDSAVWLYFIELAGSVDVKQHVLFLLPIQNRATKATVSITK